MQIALQAMSNPQDTVRSCRCESHWFSSGWRCYCFADELPTEFGYCNMQQAYGRVLTYDRGLRAPPSRIPEAECFSCPTISTSVSSVTRPPTELVGSVISSWSAHCRDVQQEVLGVLSPPTPTPESQCRVCAGTGCVFCGGAVGAYYQRRQKERDAAKQELKELRRKMKEKAKEKLEGDLTRIRKQKANEWLEEERAKCLYPGILYPLATNQKPEVEHHAVLRWKDMFASVYKTLKKNPTELFIRYLLVTRFGFDDKDIEEIRCKYCNKKLNVSLPVGGHVITRSWGMHRDSNQKCQRIQRSMNVRPGEVAWKRKYLIDQDLVELFVAVFHQDRLWDSGTGYDKLELIAKFHTWCRYCLDAERVEEIAARLLRIDRMLDFLNIKSAAKKQSDWKKTFWEEEDAILAIMMGLSTKPPGVF